MYKSLIDKTMDKCWPSGIFCLSKNHKMYHIFPINQACYLSTKSAY